MCLLLKKESNQVMENQSCLHRKFKTDSENISKFQAYFLVACHIKNYENNLIEKRQLPGTKSKVT
jgi:hypothetical protein